MLFQILCFSVRIYDSRVGDSVLSFWGHAGTPLVVQMDAWKAASGGSDGMLCIWDQRMMSKLWESHERFVETLTSFWLSDFI